MAPLFSIITVTYNAEAVIIPTLNSVKAQSFSDFEYIVVDGLSSDNTIKLVNEANINNIKIISEKDNGIYDAMNKAIAIAKGEYLIFLNAGDSFSEIDTLHTIADTAKRTHADIVYGQTQLVNDNREVIGMRHLTAPARLHFKSFRHGMVVCHQAFIARRKIAKEYDMSYRFSADYEWCLRCLRQSKKNSYCGNTIINFLAGGTTAKNHRESLKERFRIMRKYYGTIPTILYHISFIPRFIFRKNKGL
ncbi:MAG: glycosyltransferase family 2 protein [Muribaculaceae bacterium]|nr:glycosyltransferase family 2 protein [Muribaculaceae bacterium]